MSTIVRQELLATFGKQGLILFVLYVYSLGSSLLIGASLQKQAGVLDLTTTIWTAGDIAVVVGAAASFARFARSARELRLPDHRPVMLRSYALLLTLLVLVPIVLFRIFIPDGCRLIWITLAMPLGLLWPKLAQFVRSRMPSRVGVLAKAKRYPIRSPSDAIRVYFGNAFAPVPIDSRVFNLRILGVALLSVPLLVLAETDIARPVRWLAPSYLALIAGLTWVWLMTGLARFIVGRAAAYSELALLPGLGNPARQRRAFYLAALARPMGVYAFFSTLALLLVWSTSHTMRLVMQVAALLVFLALLSSGSIVGQLLVQRSGRTPTVANQVYLLSAQLYVAIVLMNSASTLAHLADKYTLIYFSSLLFLAAILLLLVARYARRLARRPHPFLH
jgi:hypothetical protein